MPAHGPNRQFAPARVGGSTFLSSTEWGEAVRMLAMVNTSRNLAHFGTRLRDPEGFLDVSKVRFDPLLLRVSELMFIFHKGP